MDSHAEAEQRGVTENRAIGKYRLVAAIGHGGMADVYLAASQGPAGFNKLLVVKELRPALAFDPEFLTMFLDEARLAARLNHPNVVQTYEVGTDDERYFIAMEYLDGQPLHRVLRRASERRNTLPLEAHLRILSEVLGGLHYAHDLRDFDGTPLQVVHRDVSPQNVFITYDGQIKLVDFGIAKALDSAAQTRAGTFKGKASYMAPEQARGEEVDRRSDVFAVGVMLWEALAKRRMWKGVPEVSVVRRMAAGDFPDLREHAAGTDEGLLAICERALAVEPARRFASAAEFQAALEAWLARQPDPMPPRKVGELVAAAFSGERERMRAVVEQQLRRLREAPDGDDPLPSLSRTSVGGRTPTSRHTAVTSTNSGAPLPGIEADRADPDAVTADIQPHTGAGRAAVAEPRRASWGPWVLASAGALIAVGTAGFVVVQQLNPPAAAPAAAAAGTLGPAAENSPATPAGGDPPAPANAAAAPPIAPAPAGDRCAAPNKPVIELSGEIEDVATLTCDKSYLLKFTTFVKPGAVLTIEPGTTIKGDKDTKGTLVVQPGGRIEARGTADKPILFTSEYEPGRRRAGDWGGVIILGRAPLNLRGDDGAPVRGRVEGITIGGEFGGDDPDDDSGHMSYVRIEYSGIELGPNNEINGLTLAGVGRRTELHHIQVRNTADDCFEFFGGTAQAKYLLCQNPGDDGLDWDFGYHGKVQFFALQDNPASSDSTNGLEGDNDPNGSLNEPISAPELWNVTLCGKNRETNLDTYGVLARRGSRGSLNNAIITGFPAAIDIRDASTEFELRNTLVWRNLMAPIAYVEQPGADKHLAVDDDVDETAYYSAAERAVVELDPGIRCFGPEAPQFGPPQPQTEHAAAPPDDGFFDAAAAYVGAFRDADDRWDAGGWAVWTDV
jgi:serine/threonine protein kinase